MVWASFTSHGNGALHTIDAKIDGAVCIVKYCIRVLFPSTKRLFKKMQVDVPAEQRPYRHTVNLILELFNKRKSNVLRW